MDVIFQHIRLPLSYQHPTYINPLPVIADTRERLFVEDDHTWQIVAIYEHETDEERCRIFKFTGTQVMHFQQFKQEHYCQCSHHHPGRMANICRICGREKL